jgi:fatty acid-binding protein DegV
LFKGGRCSALSYFGANLLRIKPQIIVKDGKMTSHHKYRGKNSMVIENYCKETLEEFSNPDLDLVFITYSGRTSQDMIDAARKVLVERGFKNIIETNAGATISSHCGPKCLGILYFNDGGNK